MCGWVGGSVCVGGIIIIINQYLFLSHYNYIIIIGRWNSPSNIKPR